MLNSPTSELLQQLKSLVGPNGYLDQATDIEPFLLDHHRLYRGNTPLVLRPDSTAQVSAILGLCHTHRVGVVPVGGNTSYCGGATPSADGTQIVLSLARLNKVRQRDADNNTITVEAGCILADIQQQAEAINRLFPLSLGSEGSCQIGGNLATNAGGTAVLRYGMARDLVLGLEVVLADGRVLDDLNALRKNNTGYDLKHLFMGAEGTLGVITAATLKLYPQPRTRVTALLALQDPAAAVQVLSHLRAQVGETLSTFELMPRPALEMVFKHVEDCRDPFDTAYPWYVLMEATAAQADSTLTDDYTHALVQAQEQDWLLDALLAQSNTQREMFWRLRESIPTAQRIAGGSIKHDISVAISDLPRFMEEGSALCQQLAPEGTLVTYGHLGDGSLHFNISAPMQGDKAAFMAKASDIHRAMHDLVARYRGSISAEHGIGQSKVDDLAHYKNNVALQVMHGIKQALDPHGIMNPGKVLR